MLSPRRGRSMPVALRLPCRAVVVNSRGRVHIQQDAYRRQIRSRRSPTAARRQHAASRDPVITLDHVVKRFGSYVAVQEANFAIERGEFFSLLGPSGCGKTTTLRMIAGFEQPTDGPHPARRPGRLPGPALPAQRQHRLPALRPVPPHDRRRQRRLRTSQPEGGMARDRPPRVEELLAVVRLAQFADRKPAQLSGGQQQRVALARALANYPSALLLDEPLGALDLKLRQAMQIELKRIQREVGHHVHLRDPRPGRSAHHVRPHRGHERGPGRADRHAAGDLPLARPRSSSPTSSAWPTCIPAVVQQANGADATVVVAGSHRVAVPAGTERLRPGSRRHGDGAARAAPADRGGAHRRRRRCRSPSSTPCSRGRWSAARSAPPTAAAIVAHVGPEQSLPMLQPGLRLWVCWDHEAARLLPATDGAPDPGLDADPDLRHTIERATVRP